MCATPMIFRARHPVDQSPGSLDLPSPPEAFKDTRPDKQRLNVPSPRPSFDFHRPFRQLLSILTGAHSSIFAAAVKCLAVSRAPKEHRQPTLVLRPGLSITRLSTAHSHQRKFRIIRALALLHYHSLGQEPSGPSFSFGYGGHGDGSSQAPGGIDSRLEDGAGFWSGPTVDSEAPPNTGPQSINLHFGGGLSQDSASRIALNTEHQMPTLSADLDPGPAPSDLGAMFNAQAQSPVRLNPSLIPDDNSPTNGFKTPSIPAPQTQPSQPNQQPTASPEPAPTLGESPSHEGTEERKHKCDSCSMSFPRPYLLKDHKRTHTGEETSSECRHLLFSFMVQMCLMLVIMSHIVYHCEHEGCDRVYKSRSNMIRHFKIHTGGDSSRSPPSMSDAQMPDETGQSPGAGPSTQNGRNRIDRGTSSLSDVRFHPYETPDSVRHKVVQRQK